MATALSSPQVDWRDISRRLNDPKQRRSIVSRADTEELNRLRTKNAYVKRKRQILNQILKLTDFYTPKPLSVVITRPGGNGSRRAGPPSSIHGVGPSSGARRPTAGGGADDAAAAAAAADESDSEVDMGDYERRIRPSSAFWRRPDGMSLAEKIIYYRNWKHRPMDGDIETTLAEYRRLMMSTRRSAKSAAVLSSAHRPDAAAAAPGDSPRRPVSVIPKITMERHDAVMFPLIDTRSHVLSRSSRDLGGDDRLPSIETNQFVSRRTAETETEMDGGEDGKNKNKKNKKKKKDGTRAPKDPRPNTEPDRLIKKLDRRMERDLRGLQGKDNDDHDDDDDDDDDSDVDEETMNDLLFGEKSKEFDRYFKS